MTTLIRPYVDLGPYTSTGELFVRDGLTGSVAAILVQGNPNGVRQAIRGQLAIDVATGAIYQALDNATSWALLSVAIGATTSDPIYGSGIDGALVFDGVSTVALAGGRSITPSAGVYSLSAVGDLNATAITVAAGATIQLAGWAMFARGTVTIAGTVADDGAAAVNQTAGAARAVNRFGSGGAGSAAGGNSGGSGSTLPGVVSAATLLPGGAAGVAGNNGAAFQGGSGGGSGGAGGSAGAISVLTLTSLPSAHPYSIVAGRTIQGNTAYTWGGGGASGNQSGTLAGAGGAGGGVAFVAAPTISGSGTIAARGGNGGNCAGTNSGGGGGGGGGLVCVVSQTVAGSLTLTAAGGIGGNGQGTGARGGNGGAGAVLVLSL